MANLFLTGSGLPTPAVGEVTDYYRNTETNLIYYHSPTGWEAVPSLIPTPDGVGTNWLFGTGAPDNGIGDANDYYRDDDNGIIYRKHAVNGWEAKGSLDFIGVYGVQWGEGLGAPANTEPLNNLPAGSFYLDVETSNIYYKDPSLTWVLKGQLGSGAGGGGGGSVTVIDNLTSTSSTDPLSANMGRELNQDIVDNYQDLSDQIGTINNTLTSYGDIVTHYAYEFVTPDALATELQNKADLVGGFVPASQLPSFVDDILEYADLASFPLTGETGKLYVALDSNLVYRWSGTGYAATSPSLALGETINTAYRGDRGKIAYDHSQATGNPHGTAIADISGLESALAAAGSVTLNATGTLLTLEAGKNYVILVSASTTINVSALTGTVQFIGVGSTAYVLTFTATPKTVADVRGTAITSTTLTAFTQAWLAPNPLVANSLRYQKATQTLASDVVWAATTNTSPNSLFWSAPNFTAPRTYTLVDKSVNFGDLPSVGTTQGNSLTGTNPIALGCTNTTVEGTNNVGISCHSSLLRGNNNLAQGCYTLTLTTNMSKCLFNNLHNDYTSPLAAIAFGGHSLENVEFSGWVNSIVAATPFAKGYKVYGHKQRKVTISGITDTRINAVDTEVALAVTSSTAGAVLKCASDDTAYPTNFAAGVQSYVVKHELDIKGISEGSAYFEGRRLITYIWNGATIQLSTIETLGTDRTHGTFTPSITTSSTSQVSGIYKLDITVQNTADTQQVFWEATLRSSAESVVATI